MERNLLNFTEKNGKIIFSTQTGFSLESGNCEICLTGNSKIENIKSQLQVKSLSSNAIEFSQVFENNTSDSLEISAIKMLDGMLKLDGKGWNVIHSELFKKDLYFEGYNFYTGELTAPVQKASGEYGLSEDSPFPGIFFTHPERGTILMAVLSQERCKPLWNICSESTGNVSIKATECFTGIPCINIESGEKIFSEKWAMLFSSEGVEEAIDEYYKLLKERIKFYGENSILRKAIVWGSWNYNTRSRGMGDVCHDYVTANASKLSEMAKDKPCFMMIDDGYQYEKSTCSFSNWFSHGFDFFYNDGKPVHDPKLFPEGMKGVAEAIKKAGAEPAIWLTLRIHKDSSLAKDHPDWLIQLENNKSFSTPKSPGSFLDYSLPEVRSFIRYIWETIFKDWGFKGLKLDFWTYPYDNLYVRFRKTNKTAIELKRMFLQDLREFVPDDGYIINCCTVNSGNPFIGEYVDAVRYALDISDGTFPEVLESAHWLTTVIPFLRHDCLLADPDSIGWNSQCAPELNRLWATIAFLTGSVCEIGGDLNDLKPEIKEFYEKIIDSYDRPKRTGNCFTNGNICSLPANHLVLECEDGIYEGYLNWRRFSREIFLEKEIIDIWTGKRISGKYKIPSHDAVLFKREAKVK